MRHMAHYRQDRIAPGRVEVVRAQPDTDATAEAYLAIEPNRPPAVRDTRRDRRRRVTGGRLTEGLGGRTQAQAASSNGQVIRP
jgi:hypothetical protein